MEKEIKLSLTENEVNLILGVLGKQPFEVVHELISKIVIQGRAQLEPKTEDKQ